MSVPTSMPTSVPTSAVRGYRASRAPLASTSLDLLDRSRGSLLQACRTGDAGERYVEAHLGALRAAAALLAARSIPSGAGPSGAGRSGGSGGRRGGGTGRMGRPVRGGPSEPARPARGRAACGSCCRAWRRAHRVVGVLRGLGAGPAVERGSRITGRESDDLLRQAENFLEIIQDLLGLPRDAALAPISRYVAPMSRSGAVSGVGPGGREDGSPGGLGVGELDRLGEVGSFGLARQGTSGSGSAGTEGQESSGSGVPAGRGRLPGLSGVSPAGPAATQWGVQRGATSAATSRGRAGAGRRLSAGETFVHLHVASGTRCSTAPPLPPRWSSGPWRGVSRRWP